MLIKENKKVYIDDIHFLTFSKKELLGIIEEIPDDTDGIEIEVIAYCGDDTVYRIAFNYSIEREETSLEKTLREAREVREARKNKREDAIKKIEEREERELYEKLKAKYN